MNETLMWLARIALFGPAAVVYAIIFAGAGQLIWRGLHCGWEHGSN